MKKVIFKFLFNYYSIISNNLLKLTSKQANKGTLQSNRKTNQIQAQQKTRDARSSKLLISKKRSEELKKNDENSSAFYTQGEYERIFDEELAENARNEDTDDGHTTGTTIL